MGNDSSKQKKAENKTTHANGSSEGKTLNNTKQVLLVHKSSNEQVKAVRNFRDALTTVASGSIRVSSFVNVAEGTEKVKDLPWLDEVNNVLLICLTPEAITHLEEIVRNKRFADENGVLHGKVFSISFGRSLASKWPPKGMKSASSDARNFCFEFPDVEKLKPQDFETSGKMQALVSAIKGTN